MQVLEKYFDTAFDAPDGIIKLRELILTLAMQGKLVPQDSSDQPASELLKEIEKEKEQLIKEKKIKKPKPLGEVQFNEMPFEIPNNWEWVYLGNITTKLTDGSHNPPRNSMIGYPMLSSQNVNYGIIDFSKPSRYVSEEDFFKENKRTDVKSGDVLLTIVASLGRSAVVPNNAPKFVLQRSVAVISSPINSVFLSQLFVSSICLNYYDTHAKGTAQKGIYLGKLSLMPIPLPPLNEQQRIVEKINQLMALCDELEKLKEQKEAQKLTVHKSAINQLLDSKDESNSQKGWGFISNHFNDLYTVKENVSELRSAILQLAMQGKLVPQNPNEQPASELLKEIEKEKKANKVKSLEPIKKDEIPFEIPKSWEWLRLTDCYYSIGSKKNQIQTKDYLEKGLIPVIDQGKEFIGGYSNDEENILKLNNPVIVFGDHTKNIKYVDFDFIIGADGVKVLCPYSVIYPRFFYFVLQSYDIRNRGYARHFKLLNEKFFCLPPKNEQERIVEKINQLMALCDDLEKQIKNSSSKQTQLLNAIMSNLGK